MKATLKQGSVLLIALEGFYGKTIKNAIEGLGFYVDFIHERPRETVPFKAATRLNLGIFDNAADQYYSEKLRSLGKRAYDVVLVVRGEYMSEKSISLYRQAMPEARFVLYMWDSVKNYPFVQRRWPLYDEVYTFDPQDAARYSDIAKLRPLFFNESCEKAKIASAGCKQHDIATIATAHSDRPRVVREIGRQCEKAGGAVFEYWFLSSPVLFRFNKLTNPGFRALKRSDVHSVFMPIDAVCETLAMARATVDVEHPGQTGLTMRSIESIGLGIKLITTNASVKDYDFYNPENILVIDRRKPVLDMDFLWGEYKAVPEEVRSRYSICGWAKELLGIEED